MRNGFAMVEAMIASGIVVLAALGMGTAFQQMGRTHSKVRSVSAALGVESALQTKLQDKSTFASIANDLAAGNATSLSSLSFPIEIPYENTTRISNVTMGRDLYFDPDINPCTGCVAAGDWMLRVRVEAQKRPGPGFPVYVMAYRIDFNSSLATLSSIGTQSPSGFATTDYKWAVPPEAYINSTLIPCDPTNKEIFITGMNKVTGRANCMRLDDSVTCGPSQVADGWRVVSGNLQIHCKPLQTASIPAPPYVVQNFNPSSGDSAITGTAVVVTDSPWPLKTASGFAVPYTGRSVAGLVCPPNYRFVGTCTTLGSTSWPGYRDIGCPAGQTGGPVWTSVPATGVGAVNNSSSGNSVNCALLNPVQPTGSGYDAGWDANILVSGNCVLIPPETVPL